MFGSIVLFNGPPSVGKDTIAGAFADSKKYKTFSFADPLKRGIHVTLDLPHTEPRAYELTKNIRQDDFFGLAPRETYIEVAERSYRKVFGKAIFAKIAAKGMFREIQITREKKFCIFDLGFPIEVTHMCDVFGMDFNIYVVNVAREEASFEKRNDSRRYVRAKDVPKKYRDKINWLDLINDGTVQQAVDKVIAFTGEY